MKSLGSIRKMYATIEYWDNQTDSPGISRFADLDAWCSVVNVWRDTMDGTEPWAAVVGLKEREWDAAFTDAT